MKAKAEQELDAIYQDSIDTLEAEWTAARDEEDEMIIVDAILSHYSDRLAKIDATEEEITDELAEWAFNGIT